MGLFNEHSIVRAWIISSDISAMAEDVPTMLPAPVSIENMFSNLTYEDSMKELGFDVASWRIKVIVLSIMYITGFTGNAIVFIMLLRRRLGVSPAIRHVILNLVAADFFVVHFCILTLAVWHYTVSFEQIVNKKCISVIIGYKYGFI